MKTAQVGVDLVHGNVVPCVLDRRHQAVRAGGQGIEADPSLAWRERDGRARDAVFGFQRALHPRHATGAVHARDR